MLRDKDEVKVPFGKRPSRGSFGKKPSSGTFGKKPSNGTFGKTKSKPLNRSGSLKPSSKPLKKKSDKNLATPEEKEFMDWIREDSQYLRYPCFVCGKHNPNDPIKWHHVKLYSSDKKNHKRLIPLCDVEHHRLGKEISPHGTPKKWRETYSMEEQNAFADKVWNDFQEYKKNIG